MSSPVSCCSFGVNLLRRLLASAKCEAIRVEGALPFSDPIHQRGEDVVLRIVRYIGLVLPERSRTRPRRSAACRAPYRAAWSALYLSLPELPRAGIDPADRNADAHRALSCVALASRRLLDLGGRSAVRWQFWALDALLPDPERRTGQMSHPLHRQLQSSSRQRSGLRLLDRACRSTAWQLQLPILETLQIRSNPLRSSPFRQFR